MKEFLQKIQDRSWLENHSKQNYEKKKGDIVLAFSCPHIPYERKGYLDFLVGIREKYGCTDVICLGDEADNHAISYHESDPDLFSAGHELIIVKDKLKAWVEAFPNLKLCISNHGSLPYRKAKTFGFPRAFIKNYNEIYGVPDTWVWKDKWCIDDVYYMHEGTAGGSTPHLLSMKNAMKSLVIGHWHGSFGVDYFANEEVCLFGACAGCGVDAKSLALAYGKKFAKRPIVGCLVIENGETVTPIRMKL